ncbi:hypothetical protein M2324_004073 [Rhodovulum sulfidophilum]|uniref:DUF4238 domain-containing protein n=1 Tax=Rhodovulum sulfidophilum TaxID=35806 RepID=UPI0009082D3F|nr:DUF4238 domain-containing protein [Rhodovulum sulfidophilum]MCW2305641.1 hypothetical protein [Rhodovulum sulfidophilum]
MKNQRSKGHHYIPQALQRAFASGKQQLWYAKKTRSGEYDNPRIRNIRTFFQRRNYYTIYNEGRPSDEVERNHYGPIDNFLGELLPELKIAFEKGKLPTLEGKIEHSLREVIAEMLKRTPDFIPEFDQASRTRQMVQDAVENLPLDIFNLTPAGRNFLKKIKDPSQQELLSRSARVQAALRPSEQFLKLLHERSVRWVRCERHHSFILSSAAVARLGNGGSNGLVNPQSELWMPLLPQLAVVLVGKAGRDLLAETLLPRDRIRRINIYLMRIGKEIASSSPELLESIAGKRRNKSS